MHIHGLFPRWGQGWGWGGCLMGRRAVNFWSFVDDEPFQQAGEFVGGEQKWDDWGMTM